MSEYPVPPGFRERVAQDRRRHRRRRRVLAVALAVAVLGAIAWWSGPARDDGQAALGVTGSRGDASPSTGGPSPGGSGSGACRTPAVELTVLASAEKALLMQQFARDFSASGRTADGRCVQAAVVRMGSGRAMSTLAAGWKDSDGPRPDVWSPSGSIWFGQLAQRLAAAGRPGLVASGEVPHLAASPLVVAMPRPMATALGWPDRPLGWSDLLTLSTDRSGWARFGHPEWGAFQLGKTNPNFSHAGLEGTIAAYYAATGKTSGLSASDVTDGDVRRLVAGVEQSVVRYGDTTDSFLADWLRADDDGKAMSYLSALVTEENTVAGYDTGNPTADPKAAGSHGPPTVPLVSIYPKEGTFVADHPWAVLQAPWVDDAKRAAAAAFLGYLTSPAARPAWQAMHFRTPATVQDPGGTTTDGPDLGILPQQPSRLLSVPTPQVTNAVLAGWSQLRKLGSTLTLVDVSGSMAQPVKGAAAGSPTKLKAAQLAASSSLSLFTDKDENGLWTFAGGSGVGQDWHQLVARGPVGGSVTAAGTTLPRRDALHRAIRGLRAGGDTGLYNSVAAAWDSMVAGYRTGRINALVVLTDGRNDARGGLTLQQLLSKIRGTSADRPVRIITIAYGPDADATTLATLARATKGASYVAATPADMSRIFAAALSNA